MRDAVHTLLVLIKWPLALVLVVTLPVVLLALLRVLLAYARQPAQWWPIVAGLAAFGLLRLLRRGGTRPMHWLYTLEHELTHALFALLTFNRITRLSAARGSGETEYEGRANWLISLAPYFFPTFCVLPLVALHLAVPAAKTWLLGLLGITLGLHLHGTAQELHRAQPDLHRHGLLASVCILPGAMALALLVVLAAVPGQWQLAVNAAWGTAQEVWRWVVGILAP
jgi:Peptidase M50B-like